MIKLLLVITGMIILGLAYVGIGFYLSIKALESLNETDTEGK